MKEFYEKYGLSDSSKFEGTSIPANFKYRDNLEKVIEKHYALTRFKDAKDEVVGIRKLFDGGLEEWKKKQHQKMEKKKIIAGLKEALLQRISDDIR